MSSFHWRLDGRLCGRRSKSRGIDDAGDTSGNMAGLGARGWSVHGPGEAHEQRGVTVGMGWGCQWVKQQFGKEVGWVTCTLLRMRKLRYII